MRSRCGLVPKETTWDLPLVSSAIIPDSTTNSHQMQEILVMKQDVFGEARWRYATDLMYLSSWN